ncbi:putative MFS transporter [Durotheca rogersii]|uniref:putative MFS transporter n=1 Tax=Durotheca rogersii TaxID=419775 RepID=UPI00221FE71D|nr:putative MFS transporter [Durotheca rogersii]KAI5860343.1 putative MFS transporter [Durotheca rogersii]
MEAFRVDEPTKGTKTSGGEVGHRIETVVTVADHDAADEQRAAFFEQFDSAGGEWHRGMARRLMRKIDAHLLPMLILMYLLNFLDRNNLSQARLGTLEADLMMTGTDFNLATSILFVGYLLMQLPSNLLLTRVRPSIYLGAAMSIWGIISTAQAAVRTFASLVVCRFFLGFAEAPFFPGAVFLMSSWYTRAELAHRIAWFYSGHSLANAFGGLLGAGVLGNLSGAHGISGWRWLFIIEGTVTIGSAICSTFVLPDYPATTRWLTAEERAYAQWRLVRDAGEGDAAGASTVREGLALALRDPRLYLFTLLQHASLLSQTFQYFFPTIVQTLGYGTIETLLLTVPVWVLAFVVSLITTYTAGRYADRSIHIICLMLISVAGNIIVVSTLSTGVRIFALFLLPLGSVPAYQTILAWVANSFPRPLVKRSACISIANMIGNSANIYGTYMYPASDGPRYLAGGSSTAAVALLTALLALAVRLVLRQQNRALAAREGAGDAPAHEAAPGEQARRPRATVGGALAAPPGFRYIL